MVDKYPSYDEMAANHVEGEDYIISYNIRPPNRVSSIAVHGGGIEVGTTELAREVGAINSHNFYTFEAKMPSNNGDLHITSIRFNEARALNVQDQSDFTISFHGAAGDTPKSLMGGIDLVKSSQVADALTAAGFVTEIASEELNGNSPSNIANKNRTRAGVQIELTTEQRIQFFINRDWSRAARLNRQFTEEFFNYINAIASVTSQWEAETVGTPNYRLNLAKPSDPMNDFERWINSNYTVLEGAPGPNVITTDDLPVAGSYELGDRVFHSPTNSIYILICKDDNWGWFWRPVHKAMGPWVNVPSTAATSGLWDLAPFPTRPVQIALDNRGKCHWRGVFRFGSFTIQKNQDYQPFKTLPFGFRPRETQFIHIGHQNLTVGSTDWEGVRLVIPDGEDQIVIRAQGGDSGPTSLATFYINGNMQYPIGSGQYKLP